MRAAVMSLATVDQYVRLVDTIAESKSLCTDAKLVISQCRPIVSAKTDSSTAVKRN